jgi:pimeloyl-ACP methyl ester carboxylesterase
MKNTFLLFVLVMVQHCLSAQVYDGIWYGKIETPGMTIPIEMHWNVNNDGQYLMYSKQQTPKPLAMAVHEIKKGKIHWEIPRIKAQYEGTYDEACDCFKGIYQQSGYENELNWFRQAPSMENAVVPKDKPQTPHPPYPYPTEVIDFVSFDKDGKSISMQGTLSIPNGDGPFPCLVMITGSGPQDRDESLMGHKPFAVIAHELAQKGWATFRYDERGVGASSGNYDISTSADFADDAYRALLTARLHPKIDPKRVGLIGHSEGGMVAPMVAAAHPEEVYCIVSLAGTGVSGKDVLVKQSADISIAEGQKKEDAERDAEFVESLCDLMIQSKDSTELANGIKNKVVMDSKDDHNDATIEGQALFEQYNQQFNTAWMRFFISHNPQENWQKVQCPTLILSGDLDLQVNAEINTKAISQALNARGVKNNVVILANHNHLFQYTETGRVSEYAKLDETTSPETLEEIVLWLKKLNP